MTILTTCCCCLELKVGVAILGWLGAILCPLNIISVIISIATGNIHATFEVILQLLTLVLHFAVSVCLIRATQCQNKRLLLPWLVITVINIIFVNIMFIIIISHVQEAAPFIISILLTDVFSLYLWLCVYSYYQELQGFV